MIYISLLNIYSFYLRDLSSKFTGVLLGLLELQLNYGRVGLKELTKQVSFISYTYTFTYT